MIKLLYFAVLTAMGMVLACSGESPAPSPAATLDRAPVSSPVPTSTSVPAPTSEPTLEPTAVPTVVPTPAVVPTATQAATPSALTPGLTGEESEGTDASGGIVPLSMGDPDALMSQVPAEELGCLMAGADLSRLVQLQQDPTLATPEETEKAIACLGDESALRAFLTELIGLTGPLSVETSDCLRTVFGTFDVRSVMLARQVAPGRQESRSGNASAFFLTISCLNEEEWLLYVPPMIMDVEDREKLQCVVASLGGSEELAAVLQSGDGGVPGELSSAAADCGLHVAFLSGG